MIRKLDIGCAGVVALMLLLSGGCGKRTTAEAGVTVRDSAGVRIVEYASAPRSDEVVKFAGEPLYRYGEEGGERTFQMIMAGALEPDGSAVIADGGTQEVTVLTADGKLEGVLAHAGKGPDEVGRVMSVNVLGQDAVVVEDDGNGRFMQFDGGKLSRSVSTVVGGSSPYGLRAVGVDSADGILMETSSFRPGFSEPWLQGRFVQFDLATGVTDTVGEYDLVQHSPSGDHINPFAPSGIVAATAGHFVYGRTDVMQVTWFTSEGRERQVLRWKGSRRYPTDADLKAFQENMRADLRRVNPKMPDERFSVFVQEQMKRFQVVEGVPMPVFMQLLSDGQGGVWIGEYAVQGPADGPRRFDVVAADGTWLGTANVPSGFRVLAVRGRRALGVLRDQLDVQSVAVFEFALLSAN